MRVTNAGVQQRLKQPGQSLCRWLNGNGLPFVIEYRYAISNRILAGFHALNPDQTDPTNFDQYRLWKSLTYREMQGGTNPFDFTFNSSLGGGNQPVSTLPNDPIPNAGAPGGFQDDTIVVASSPLPGDEPAPQVMTQSDGNGTPEHTLNSDEFHLNEVTLATEVDYSSIVSGMRADVNGVNFNNLWTGNYNLNIGYDEWPRTRPATNFSSFYPNITGVALSDFATGYSGGQFTTTPASDPTGHDPHDSAISLTLADAGLQYYQASFSRVQIRGIRLPPNGIGIILYEDIGPAFKPGALTTSVIIIRDQHRLMPGEIYEFPQPSITGLAKQSIEGYEIATSFSNVRLSLSGINPGNLSAGRLSGGL